MLLSLGVLPWWAWLLCAAGLALLSLLAAVFAILPADSRPGGWGCLLGTVLLFLGTLVTAGLGVVQLVTSWRG